MLYLLFKALCLFTSNLSGRDIEPFGNRWVDRCRRLPGVGGYAGVRLVVPPDKGWGVGDGDVAGGQVGGRRLSSDETTPSFMAFMNNLGSVALVLGFSGESKGVFRLSIGDFVDPKPFVGSPDQTRQVPLNVFDIVELGSKRILDINNDHFPVGLSLIKEGHDSENLDLLHLTDVANLLTDFADIERIVIALGLGLGVSLIWVFPGLREGTVVPNVSVVRETVSNVAETTSLDVLLDRVESLLLGDLHLGVGPARDFDDHVEDAIVLVGEERDIVPWGNDGAVLLNEHSMFECVGCPN